MPKRENGIPKEWLRYKHKPFEAQIVSIHTGISQILFKMALLLSLLWVGLMFDTWVFGLVYLSLLAKTEFSCWTFVSCLENVFL